MPPHDLIPLREFLFAQKTRALDGEKRSKGRLHERFADQIQILDSILIFITSAMEEHDMAGLKLRLESTPIPTGELKKKSRDGEELRQAIIEFAKQVPKGFSQRVLGLDGIKPDSLASKIWAMRERGVLPAHIVPLVQTNKETREKEFYITHKTPDEMARMKRGGKLSTRTQK